MSVRRSRILVNRWKHILGFGHWRIYVYEIPNNPTHWAISEWDVHEEWARIGFVADRVFPEEQRETLVLHEFAHGLLELAKTSEVAEEQFCNRFARLLARDGNHLANEYMSIVAKNPPSDELNPAVREALRVAVDRLPDRERQVIEGLYYERVGPTELAERLKVSRTTVYRIRDQAILRLEETLGSHLPSGTP